MLMRLAGRVATYRRQYGASRCQRRPDRSRGMRLLCDRCGRFFALGLERRPCVGMRGRVGNGNLGMPVGAGGGRFICMRVTRVFAMRRPGRLFGLGHRGGRGSVIAV